MWDTVVSLIEASLFTTFRGLLEGLDKVEGAGMRQLHHIANVLGDRLSQRATAEDDVVNHPRDLPRDFTVRLRERFSLVSLILLDRTSSSGMATVFDLCTNVV